MLQRHHTRNHIRKQQFLSQCTSILHDRQAQMLWTSAAVFNYKIKVLKRLKKINLLITQEKTTVIRFYMTSDLTFDLASKKWSRSGKVLFCLKIHKFKTMFIDSNHPSIKLTQNCSKLIT